MSTRHWLVTCALAGTARSSCGTAASAPASFPAKSTAAAGTPVAAASGASTTPAQSSQLTAAELKARLLVEAGLPHGYVPYATSTDFPESSDKPACMTTLNDLSSPSPPGTAVTQASTAFAASQSGPWIQEVLRSYPQRGAARAFTATTAILAKCRNFTVAWTAPAETAAESIQPLGPVHAGDRSWSASLTVKTNVPLTETLVLVQVGSSQVILQVASAAGLPTLAQVSAQSPLMPPLNLLLGNK